MVKRNRGRRRFRRRHSDFWRVVHNYMRQGHSKEKAIYLAKKQFAKQRGISRGFHKGNIFRKIPIVKALSWVLFIAGLIHVVISFSFIYPIIILFVFMASEFFTNGRYRWKVFFYTTAIYGAIAWFSYFMI